jgi:hypothetical protein
MDQRRQDLLFASPFEFLRFLKFMNLAQVDAVVVHHFPHTLTDPVSGVGDMDSA